MANERPPWFKFDPSAFLADAQVDAMTTLELGACLRLLCRQWIDGDLPGDLHTLGRLCRLDGSGMGDAWVTLCHFFPEIGNGRRANRFMWIEREQVMAAMEKKSSDGEKAARKRWESLGKTSDATPNGSPMPHPMQDKEEEKEKEQHKNTQSPTAPSSSGGKKSGKMSKGGFDLEIPEEILRLATRVKDRWPRTSYDQSPVRIEPAKLISRLQEVLLANPAITAERLEAGVDHYLGQTPPPKRWCAPQNFFGPGVEKDKIPIWLENARAAYKKAELLKPKEPTDVPA